MQKEIVLLVTLASLFLLSGCDILARLSSGTCSGYNGYLDEFQISFDKNSIELPHRESTTLVLKRSWLNDDLQRNILNCKPDLWEYIPDNIVKVDEESYEITATALGNVTVRAVVNGSGGTKTAEISVKVIKGPCSSYNTENTAFELSFNLPSIQITKGASKTVDLESTWVNDDGIREAVSCKPNNIDYSAINIANLDPETLTIKGSNAGTTIITVVVPGNVGTKSASIQVEVTE